MWRSRELAELGYTNVKDYKGGKKEWMDTGLPTEKEWEVAETSR